MKHNKLDDNESKKIQYVSQIYNSKLFGNISWIKIEENNIFYIIDGDL